MTTINIENKAVNELQALDGADLATAFDLRKALLVGVGRVERVAGKLADIERKLKQTEVFASHADVREGLELLMASRHGDLLRERVVNVHVHESDDDWVDDGLLIECGTGYLSVYCTASERVFDVLEPKDLRDSNYGLHDVADAVEQVRLFLDHDGGVDESEMEDENGNAWCKFDQAWDGDNDAYEGEE